MRRRKLSVTERAPFDPTARSRSAALAAAAFGAAALGAPPTALCAESGLSLQSGRLEEPPQKLPPASAPVDARPPVTVAPTISGGIFQTLNVIGEDDPALRAEMQRAAAPLFGQPIGKPMLLMLSARMDSVLARRGLALHRVVIAPQTFAEGKIEARVLKGYVREVTVTGLNSHGARRARAMAFALVRERPLRQASLDRAMALIAETPGLKLSSRFEAIKDDPNAVRLVLAGKQRAIEAGVSVNNGGQSLLGRTQIEATVRAPSVFVAGDEAQFYYGVPADLHQYKFAALTYALPLGADGWRARAAASRLTTEPDNSHIRGSATSLSLSASYPLIRSRARATTLSIAVDALASDNAFLGQTFASDRTRVARLSASDARIDARGATSATLTASFGADAFGARVGMGSPDFVKANLQAGRTQMLARRTRLKLSAQAQLAGSALPASERLQFGGLAFGRGYDAGAASADSGLEASAELGQQLFAAAPAWLGRLEAFAFVDGAALDGHVFYARSDERRFASAGLGASLAVARRGQLTAQWAQPMTAEDRGGRFVIALTAQL